MYPVPIKNNAPDSYKSPSTSVMYPESTRIDHHSETLRCPSSIRQLPIKPSHGQTALTRTFNP